MKQIKNFSEALVYMKQRMNYYESIGEPADWECRIRVEDEDLGDYDMWIRQLGDNFYDTLIPEEQTGGCRVTTPMDLEELELLVGDDEVHNVHNKFICGELWDGNNCSLAA